MHSRLLVICCCCAVLVAGARQTDTQALAAGPGRGRPSVVTSPRQRWDQILVGDWYVPPSNLLAYFVISGHSEPIPLGDQTVFRIHQAHNGEFTGESFTELFVPSSLDGAPATPITFVMTGLVTPDGQIRITFTNSNTTVIGLGSMELVNGRWRMTMQMSTGTFPYVIHWAYMTKQTSGVTPPPPSDLQGPLPSDREWRWLEGSVWAIRDTELFDSSSASRRTTTGFFEIETYCSGYFWGSGGGGGAGPFSVVGTVTPEGSLYLVLTAEDGSPLLRTGTLAAGPRWQAGMLFRSVEGTFEQGAAMLLGY